jgi:hypothetical protein
MLKRYLLAGGIDNEDYRFGLCGLKIKLDDERLAIGYMDKIQADAHWSKTNFTTMTSTVVQPSLTESSSIVVNGLLQRMSQMSVPHLLALELTWLKPRLNGVALRLKCWHSFIIIKIYL